VLRDKGCVPYLLYIEDFHFASHSLVLLISRSEVQMSYFFAATLCVFHASARKQFHELATEAAYIIIISLLRREQDPPSNFYVVSH